jgi:HK97 family phage portal protein
MWPFKKKTLPVPMQPLRQQITIALKSLSLPQASPNWSLYARTQERWDVETAIIDGYNASAVVYAAVEKRAKLVAAVPWQAKRRLADGTYEHVPNSPLQALIDRPNPDQSWYELIYEAEQSICLAGNAFISEIKAGSRNQPTQLWILPAQFMRIKPGREKLVDYFEYTEQNGKQKIMAEDMVQLKMPNPNDRYFGQPVLLSASRATDIDREAADWQKTTLQQRGTADYHLELPDGTTPEQAKALKQAWQDEYSGTRSGVMATSAKVTPLGTTAVEMDFVNSRRAVWTEIAAVFGVPLAAMGFTESVNLANANAMNKQLYQDTIIPQLELYRRQLTSQLAYEFGPEWILDYDLSGIEALQQNFDVKLANAEKLYRMGVPFATINDALELGIDEFAGWDLGPLAGLGEPEPEQDEEETDEEEKRMLKALGYGA